MSKGEQSEGADSQSVIVNSNTCEGDVLESHLERALESANDPDTRFHLREGLQLLNSR